MTAVSLVACETVPKSEQTVVGEAGSAEGQWRGKALVRDRRNGKSGVLSLDILAKEPSQLRMEVTGSFGVHVASIALNGGEVRYILSREKRFITASADADSLTRLVPVRIPPTALLAVLFERTLPKAEWDCEDAGGLASSCKNREEDVSVRWLERKGRNRRLKIAAPEAEIEMVLDEAKSKVELNADAFTLNAPSGYKQEHL